ncbi:MAG: penicillin-binding protein 2 [Lachnospiraceae bacterium]|nr:penicillin-binding protein 2 [Lachnospiraceae bacterium]
MMAKRFNAAIIVFLILFAVLIGRLIWIVVLNGEKYSKAAQAQSETATTTLSAKRGDIIDRNHVQLVTSPTVYTTMPDPKVILSKEDKFLEPTVALINKHFEIPTEELRGKIADNPNSSYIVLKKGLTFSEIEEFLNEKEADRNVRGVWMENSFHRNYTYNTLASSVLGFTQDGVGIYGIESQYDDELTGNDGMEYTYLDSENNLQTVRKDPEDGYTVRLTMDYNIQAIVEKWIAASWQETEAKNIGCIIQNPNTGEILAMADSGNFDPNNPRDLTYCYTQEQIDAMSDQEVTDALSQIWRNFCVTQSFEPGSTFKPFTVAIGIEENRIKPTDTFDCYGCETFFPDTPWEKDIWCHNRDGCGTLDVKGAIANSCNISLAQISQRIGSEFFCKYQQKFGFGQYTDIDLPNEMSCQGLLYNVNNMTVLDLSTNSFGQNFNATMIQMSTAFCSLINGGNLYRPYIVKDIFNSKNELVRSNDRVLVSQTISQSTSNFVKECLRAVITDGTGGAAAVEGYKIAGKTGTAQKYDKEGDYYVISFEGFAPYDNPEVVCYVAIDEPITGEASRFSSELFSNIMTEVLSYMNIAPDDVE